MARGQVTAPLRRIVVSGLAVLSILLVGVPGATADIVLRLSVDSETRITVLKPDGSGVAEGTFTAVGLGLGTEAECSSGTVRSEFATVTDDQGLKIVRAIETYTCADGSGSFTAQLVGRRMAVDGPAVTFAATIALTEATGAYSKVQATGVGTTVVDLSGGAVRNAYALDVRSAL